MDNRSGRGGNSRGGNQRGGNQRGGSSRGGNSRGGGGNRGHPFNQASNDGARRGDNPNQFRQQQAQTQASDGNLPRNSVWGQPGAMRSHEPPGLSSGPPQPTAWRSLPQPGSSRDQAGATQQKQQQQQQQQQNRPTASMAGGSDTRQRETAGSQVVQADSRGSMRGKQIIRDEIVLSRPPSCVTKNGTSGRRINVQTNYFRLLTKPEWSIFQYRIDFLPEVENLLFRRALLNQHKHILGGYIFDGTVLFSSNLFVKPGAGEGYLELMSKSRENEIYQIKVKKVGIVEVTDSQQIQVLNLILRRSMEGLKLQLISRNFFDPHAKISLRDYHMEIWPGYQTSVRQHEKDILLCAEIAHKVMRTDTLYHILTTCMNERNYQDAYKREVVGMIVLTDYNNKTYRIDDVDFNESPRSKFSTKDGEISYLEYYKRRYHLTIRDDKQPLLVSRPTERNVRGGDDKLILLVPELSRATGMTDAMRSNFRLMKAMGDHTRLNPDRRIDRLRIFNRRLQDAPESVQVLNSWSMKLDSALVEVPGRVLANEIINHGPNKKYKCDDRADWTNEIRNGMHHSVDIRNWHVITPKRSVREVQTFVQMCIKTARGMGMTIMEPRYIEMPDDRNGTYANAIEHSATADPQIVMVVLQNNNEEKYSCIKKKCCVDRALPSQVVTLRTIAPRAEKSSGLMSIATKVSIQLNAKLKGIPWLIDLPLDGLMTVGFDVCHSSKDRNKSFGALVASMDIKQSGQYYSSVIEHLKGQELSDKMTLNMALALQAYKSTHGGLPDRILFYRDGVGDGQLHQVVNTEVKALKTKIDEIYRTNGKPNGCRLAFVVVTKRINTRLFINARNPPPGTVVDDIITLPERYDFFLVSQSVRQGTVSPTNYNVIHDNMGLPADRLQMLTYKMCHMYYNYSGTCRVPSVCQYAHKLAFLVSESIHRAPDPSLSNQLYFL